MQTGKPGNEAELSLRCAAAKILRSTGMSSKAGRASVPVGGVQEDRDNTQLTSCIIPEEAIPLAYTRANPVSISFP